MSVKIYSDGNYFFIEDPTASIPLMDVKSEVKVRLVSTGIYEIKSPLIGNKSYDIDDLIDVSDASYTLGTWNTFFRANTGFNPASGGSGANYSEFHLTTTPEVVALNDDGVTFTKIPNMILGLASGFSVATGTLTYDGDDGMFLINGVSDLEVNKATDIFYALFVNGSLVPGEVTPHTFTNQSKVENISITSIAPIAQDDDIEVRARTGGTATSVTITVRKLDVTFLEVK